MGSWWRCSPTNVSVALLVMHLRCYFLFFNLLLVQSHPFYFTSNIKPIHQWWHCICCRTDWGELDDEINEFSSNNLIDGKKRFSNNKRRHRHCGRHCHANTPPKNKQSLTSHVFKSLKKLVNRSISRIKNSVCRKPGKTTQPLKENSRTKALPPTPFQRKHWTVLINQHPPKNTTP